MKIHALLALPFLLVACGAPICIKPQGFRAGLKIAAACALSYVVLWLPFVLPPLGSMEAFNQAWRSFGTFAREWQFNALGFGILRLWLDASAARVVALMIMAISWVGIVGWLTRNPQLNTRANALKAALLGAFGVLLLMSPVINAWYLLWLLPLATATRFITPWVACIVLPLAYLTHFNLGTQALSGGAISTYTLPTAIPLFEGTAIGLALCWDSFGRDKFMTLTSRHLSASHSPKS